MVALSLIFVALALVVGGGAGLFVEVLWWAAGFVAAMSVIRILAVARRERLQPTDPMELLGGIAELMQRRRAQRVRTEWLPSDRA